MTADFFVFGNFDQKTKNEKWNESDIDYENSICLSRVAVSRSMSGISITAFA